VANAAAQPGPLRIQSDVSANALSRRSCRASERYAPSVSSALGGRLTRANFSLAPVDFPKPVSRERQHLGRPLPESGRGDRHADETFAFATGVPNSGRSPIICSAMPPQIGFATGR
jgi:hypothetical protein